MSVFKMIESALLDKMMGLWLNSLSGWQLAIYQNIETESNHCRGKFGVGNIFVKPDLRLKSISV